MIIYRLLTILFLIVMHTIANNFIEDLNISPDNINVNVGKRVRMECELNNSKMNGDTKGLWLRLEDAEVFFYSTSRIHSDRRFQIEQRTSLHMINTTLSYEIITYSLIIDDIRLSDGGTYSCQSNNKIIKLFRLNIVERPYFITHEYSTLLRTQIGRNFSINCEAQGKPIPNLSWIKKIDDNNQKMMINCSTLSSTCQLNLINISRWHNGIYECVAMNIVGTVGRFYEVDVQFSPDVYSLSEKPYHFIGDTVIIQCLIDANPEPDIRWFHRFSDDVKQEIDLSRKFSQENLDADEDKNWYIKNEQLNSTRWKTSLFIKHIQRRLFNSNFICRAKNRYGINEQSIIILEKYYSTKKYRHPFPFTYYSTVSPYENVKQLSTSTKSLLQKTNNLPNRSTRISSYLFILKFYAFLLTLYI